MKRVELYLYALQHVGLVAASREAAIRILCLHMSIVNIVSLDREPGQEMVLRSLRPCNSVCDIRGPMEGH